MHTCEGQKITSGILFARVNHHFGFLRQGTSLAWISSSRLGLARPVFVSSGLVLQMCATAQTTYFFNMGSKG